MEYEFEVVRGVKLNIYDSGAGDKNIVFIHGMPGQISNWKHQIGFFEENYRVIAYDQRGYGCSEKPLKVTFDDYILDLKELLEKRGVDPGKTVLVGHSFGGMVAAGFAGRFGVWKLVLIGAVLEIKPTLLDKILWLLPAGVRKQLLYKSNPLTRRFYRSLFFSRKAPDEVFEEFLRDNAEYIESLPPHVIDYDRILAGSSVVDEASRISCETLVLTGAEDKICPPDYARRIAGVIRNSKLIVIEDAGHLVMYEKPGLVNKLIKEFIES